MTISPKTTAAPTQITDQVNAERNVTVTPRRCTTNRSTTSNATTTTAKIVSTCVPLIALPSPHTSADDGRGYPAPATSRPGWCAPCGQAAARKVHSLRSGRGEGVPQRPEQQRGEERPPTGVPLRPGGHRGAPPRRHRLQQEEHRPQHGHRTGEPEPRPLAGQPGLWTGDEHQQGAESHHRRPVHHQGRPEGQRLHRGDLYP